MELELGLKITKTKDDIDSISEYQLMKDTGPIFQSRETNTMFIITAHLKGYKRNCIDIKISKDGSKISISGEKPVQEMVMMGWVMQRKVVDIKGFNRVFKIPYGVNLDKIKGNYNEEEWILNIYMPKIVKGIFGLKIEEVKEQEYEKRRPKLEEKSETGLVSSSVGETSQKESKDSEFQHMEGSDNGIEKMLDDNIKENNNETIQKGEEDDGIKRDVTECLIEKEKEESKLRIEDSKVKDIREKNGKEAYEALKTLEIEKDVGKDVGEASQKWSKNYEIEHIEKMLDDTNKEINKETIQKEDGEMKMGIEDGNGGKVSVNDGREQYEVMKKSELDQSVGVFVQNTIEDTSQDKRFECRSVEKKEREECEKRHDDANWDRVGSTMKKEKEESKLRIEDSKVNSTREMEKDGAKGFSHNIVDTSQRVVEGSMIQKSGEPKEKEFGEKKGNSKSRLKENVVDHNPNTIDSKSLNEFGEPMVPQMEKTNRNIEGKMNGGESKKLPFEVNEDVQKTKFGDIIQKDVTRAKLESQDEDQECIGEKLGKEGFDDVREGTINKEVDKYLPKKGYEAREGLSVQKMQENKVVKENVVKRKGREIEDFVEKDDNKRLKRMHVEAKKGNAKEITQKETEEIRENGIEESGKQPVVEIEGNKGFDVAKEENQREFMKEASIESQCLMEKVEGEESNERTNADKLQDEEEKIEHGIVKLKGHGSRKLNVEPNEHFKGDPTRDRIVEEITNQNFPENVDFGIFDGRNTQKFQETEQTEDYKENGENFEKSIKKLNGDKYQKIQNEEIGKSKQKEFGELKCETKDRLKESSMEPFEQNVVDHIPSNIGSINQNEFKEECENLPFQAKKVVQKTMFGDIIKAKMENEDGDQECVGQKPNKEGFDAKITTSEEFPKNTHEESEELNVKQMQETEDESKERTMAKRVEDEENKTENVVVKLKGEGSTKLNVEPNEPFEGDTTRDRIEKEIINQKVQENVDIGIFDERKTNMFQEMEETELAKEKDAIIEKSMKKVNGDKFKKIQNEVDEGFKKNITKEKDDCYLQEVMSKERSKEEFPMKMLDSQGDTIEGLKSRNLEKTKGVKEKSEKVVPFVKGESEEPKIPMKIKDQQCLQEEEPNDHEIEKAKMVKGIVAKRKSDEFFFAESTTKEEPQGSEIERSIFEVPKAKDPKGIETRTLEREVQCARDPTTYSTVESIGFKEFEYGSAKEKKQNTKVLPPKFQNKETQESKDESMSLKEVESIEDKVVKPLSTLRFQSTQQSEVEENDKFCEGNNENYKGSIESRREDPTKDIQNLIEMEETLKPEISLEKELKKGEKGEFRKGENVGEMMQIKTDEPKNRNDTKEKQHVAKVVTEKMDKGKFFDEKMKTTQEKETESLESSQKNDIAEVKAKRPLELEMPDLQCELPKTKDHVRALEVRDGKRRGYIKEGTEEIKAPKIEASEDAKPLKIQSPRFNQQSKDEINRKSESSIDGHEATKESPKFNIVETEKIDSLLPQILDRLEEVLDVTRFQTQNILEEEKVMKRREGPKIAKSEETKDASTFKREKEKTTLTSEEKKPKIMETTPQFDMASGSKRVSEKVHEAPKRECQRESEQVASKMDVEPPTAVEKTQIKKVEGQNHIQVLEATLSKEKEDRVQQYVQEKNDKKGFQTPKTIEEKKVLKKREGSKSEEEGEKYVMEERTTPFDKACGSKREADKVHEEEHETPEREHQRESEEFTSKIELDSPNRFEKPSRKKVERKESNEFTKPPNMDNEIPKVEEFRKVEGKKHIHELDAIISKEKERVEPKSEIGKQKLRLAEDRGQQYVQEKKGVKKRESPNVAKKEEEKKAKMKEIFPQFDKASGSKRVAENVHETPERVNQRELEVTSKIEVEPPTTVERKEAYELTWPPNMNKEIPKVEEVPKEKEREMHTHVTEATISKEKGTQVAATHSKEKDRVEPKGDIDKPPENHNPFPKEPFHSIEGSTALEVVSDKVAQQFEVEGEDKTNKRESKMSAHESEESKTGIIKDEEQEEGRDETSGWKKDNEIPKAEEEKDVERHIRVLEETVSKEGTGIEQNSNIPKNSPPKEPFHSMEGTATLEALADKDVQESKGSSSSSTQQFEVEREEKTKKKESKIDVQESTKSKRGQEVVEKCINKDEESKHGRQEIDNEEEEEEDYEQVYKEQKEDKDETSEGKKDNDKISKKLFVPFVIAAAGSALLVTIVVMFVRHRRSRKRFADSPFDSGLHKLMGTKSDHSLENTASLEAVADKVVQESKVPSSSCTQQFEVEGEEKTKRKESKMDVQDSRKSKTGQEVEQCIDKDEEAKHVSENKVVKPISAQRFQISQQSEDEENDKLFEGSEAKYRSSVESRKEYLTIDIQNLIEAKENQEAKQKETFKPEIPLEKELKKGEKEREAMQERNDEPKNKCIHETTKASQDKKHPQKLEVDEKEAESLETSLKNDFPKPKDHVQVPELKDDKQDGTGTAEVKSAKIAAYKGAKPSKLQRPMINQQSTDEINRKPEFVIEEHEGTKALSPMLNIVERENIASMQPRLLESPGREDMKAKHGTEDTEEDKTYEQVLEEEKEEKDETSEGKKENGEISKKLFVLMVLAGSAVVVTLVAIFVQHRRSRKR